MIADFFKLPTETFQLMCAQALPCRALKSWCIGQKSYCFKIQKIGLLFWPRLQPIHYQNFFKVLSSPKSYDFGKLLTLQENKYLTDIWKIATWKVWRPSPSKSSNCNESFITICVCSAKKAYSYNIYLIFTILFHQNMKCIVLM